MDGFRAVESPSLSANFIPTENMAVKSGPCRNTKLFVQPARNMDIIHGR
jgi:hypothetical protein